MPQPDIDPLIQIGPLWLRNDHIPSNEAYLPICYKTDTAEMPPFIRTFPIGE